MKRYIITIGGSGAKCLEALVHLGANNISQGTINFLHIDADKANGNANRTFTETLNVYKSIKDIITQTTTDFFGTTFKNLYRENTFYPVPVRDPNVPTYYNSLEEYCSNAEIAKLLYSKNVRNESWEVGFKGRASLGSSVVAGAFDWTRNPWNTIKQEIDQTLNANEKARIFLIGSIFGGTGSSIFPSIAKFFDNKFGNNDNFAISGALLFPYFTYIIPEDAKKEEYADPKHFLPKSKLHLEYYADQKNLKPFKNRLYILGEKHHKTVHPVTGGSKQENPPHHLEPLAIMAAIDFFKQEEFEKNKMEYRYLARDNNDLVSWTDLPNSQNIEDKFLVFTTMACSYLGFWYPLCRNEDFKNSLWFKKYIGYDRDFDAKLDVLKGYFDNYLLWLFGIHLDWGTRDEGVSYREWLLESSLDERIRLLNGNILKDFLTKPTDVEVGKRLTILKWRPQPGEEGYYESKIEMPYDYLWREACNVVIREEYDPLERLLHIMYSISMKFKENNYSS